MSRINVCKACQNIKNGVKTRMAVDHTCDKSEEELQNELKNLNEAIDTKPTSLMKLCTCGDMVICNNLCPKQRVGDVD
jgi:hypothetical protein